jgi:hypothetical protein
MSTQEYIRSITELTPDDFPTTKMPTISNNDSSGYFSWQTLLIIILILALLVINVLAFLA